jgi:hypothetical protein
MTETKTTAITPGTINPSDIHSVRKIAERKHETVEA